MEALNLRNMTVAQTPLLGDENTPLHRPESGGTGFEGATPRHQTAFTPNPLATPLNRSRDVSATPRTDVGASVSATPLRTPMRDNLSINPEDGTSFVGDTPREQRMRVNSTKRSLKAGFMNLPKPENNFELLVPDDEDEDGAEANGMVLSEEDAAERDARLKKQREEEERKALARRSMPVQLGLPRPPNVDLDQLLGELSLVPAGESDLQAAQRLMDLEIAQLLRHDSIAHPVPGTATPGGTQSYYEMPEDDYIAAAKDAIQLELSAAVGFPGAPAEQVKDGVVALAKNEPIESDSSWASLREQLVYDKSSGRWVEPSSLTPEARIAGYAALLEESRASLTREGSRATKVEKKLGITLKGYMQRFTDLSSRLVNSFEQLGATTVDLQSFERLRTNENAVAPGRVSRLKEEVDFLERREQSLQSLYKELEGEKEASERRVMALEERVMEEAEKLNEEAMAEVEGVNGAT